MEDKQSNSETPLDRAIKEQLEALGSGSPLERLGTEREARIGLAVLRVIFLWQEEGVLPPIGWLDSRFIERLSEVAAVGVGPGEFRALFEKVKEYARSRALYRRVRNDRLF